MRRDQKLWTSTRLSAAAKPITTTTHSTVQQPCAQTLRQTKPKLVDYTVRRGASVQRDDAIRFSRLRPVNARKGPSQSATLSGTAEGAKCKTRMALPRRLTSPGVIPTYSSSKPHRQEAHRTEERIQFMFRSQPRERNRTLSCMERLQEVTDALSKKTGNAKETVQRKPRKPVLFPKERRSSRSSVSTAASFP